MAYKPCTHSSQPHTMVRFRTVQVCLPLQQISSVLMVLMIPLPHVLIDLLTVLPVPCTRFSPGLHALSLLVCEVQLATSLGVSMTLGVPLCKVLRPKGSYGSGKVRWDGSPRCHWMCNKEAGCFMYSFVFCLRQRGRKKTLRDTKHNLHTTTGMANACC